MHKRLLQMLLTERQLAGGPDLGILLQYFTLAHQHLSLPLSPPSLPDNPKVKKTYRLKPLLNLDIQRTTLKGNDLGRGLGLVGNGGAALGAEPPVDGVA